MVGMKGPALPPFGEGEVRDGFKFRGGSLPLDFAATVAGRLRAEPKELLQEPDDLARWLVAAGLATKKLKVSTEELEQARALREALYRLALARADGQRLPEKDRASLNRFAEGATPAPRLDHEGVTWPHASVPQLLAMIARTGVELLGGALRDRIRHCSGEGCALLFVDTSRSGHRKWCSMAGCGNRAKVASFRERNRDA
ncbi:MAG TPA: ABATE domain-containing protein [Thermoanaerobaculia bacterium]|jgi:predicted RNA-binding Zn ribbon-like protein